MSVTSRSTKRGFLASIALAAVLAVSHMAPVRAAEPPTSEILVICIPCLTISYTPTPGLWAITSEENGDNGRGFQVELSSTTGMLVFTYYGYGNLGVGTWYLAAGSLTGNTFTAPMTPYFGGTVLGGSYHAASQGTDVGTVSITFTSNTTGTITLPGESAKAIEKLVF